MAIQKRLYTVDDVWELQCLSSNADRQYELINGELFEMTPANLLHSWLASEISGFIRDFVRPRHLGYTLVEGGFTPEGDRNTLLAPDVAFVGSSRLSVPFPQVFVGFMPDLAVEIVSPSNSIAGLRNKAAIYLRNGSSIVWIVIPDREGVEVCRLTEDGTIEHKFIGIEGKLLGDDVLPGFELELRQLFPK